MNKIQLLALLLLSSLAPLTTKAQSLEAKIDSLYQVKENSPNIKRATQLLSNYSIKLVE